MASALSSAYVLLGKAIMSEPPDWSTAVGAIHTLSSLLTCSVCNSCLGSSNSLHGTPNDSFSLICDTCHENSETMDDNQILTLLMENIKNLCAYAVQVFKNVPKIEDSEEDSEVEIKDIVIVPTHSSQAKFVSKLRKFALTTFGIVEYIKEEPMETVSVIAPPVPKAVIVTSPAKPTMPNGSNGSWIKVNNSSKQKRSHVMINGNKIGRDQIVKTTLRPSLTCPFKSGGQSQNNAKLNELNNKLSDFVVKLEELPKVLQDEKSVVTLSKKGCRCGNATPTPGKLTCGGQRCPCYVNSKSCLDCKCKGCRNPHQANGVKVIRPHLQLKSLSHSGNSQKFYISSSPLVSQNSNSMTTIRRIHLN